MSTTSRVRPQVIEGWHGLPYDKPLGRTREVVDIVRAAIRRETLQHDGKIFTLPLPADQGLGLGKPLKMLTKPERSSIPIYIAALGQKNVEGTAEYADGWLPFLFAPEKAHDVWGDALAAGTAKRPDGLGPLEIVAGGMVSIGDDVKGMLDFARPHVRALHRRHGRHAARTSTTSWPASTATRPRPSRSRTSTSAATSATRRRWCRSSSSRW